jgi:glutathione synthase/RimK-type ligase-like ATP-grasp enzyme
MSHVEMIVFATYEGRPEGQPDDRLAVDALRARGQDVACVPWSRPMPPEARAVVLRSTWDYFHRLPEFLAWLGALTLPLYNDADTARANVDKRYLRTLEAAGVPVVETAWPVPADRLADVLAARGWRDAVVKPAVSGGAFETFRVSAVEAPGQQARFAALLARGAVLVQPFLPEIVAEGELSLVYLNGRFSHAVVKRTRPDDFRVQEAHGGTHAPFVPAPALLAQTDALLRAAGADGLLYARVDGLVRHGRFELMELELTEPSLFLDARTAARFADAVLERVG